MQCVDMPPLPASVPAPVTVIPACCFTLRATLAAFYLAFRARAATPVIPALRVQPMSQRPFLVTADQLPILVESRPPSLNIIQRAASEGSAPVHRKCSTQCHHYGPLRRRTVPTQHAHITQHRCRSVGLWTPSFYPQFHSVTLDHTTHAHDTQHTSHYTKPCAGCRRQRACP